MTTPTPTPLDIAVCHLATTKHKAWLLWYVVKACVCLLRRAIVHDVSKYGALEAPWFAAQLSRLRGMEYGSPEYREALHAIRPALDHHYANNAHHPEHWRDGLAGMSPIDQIEMLCDWKAATRRHATGDIRKSIDGNADRFGYAMPVRDGYHRDADEIGL